MKKKFLIFLSILVLLLMPVYAHSGRTDENGGHYNHSTGEYHYHHGYPAHQHINGVCPYDFDDQTGATSGGRSRSNSSGSNSSVPVPSKTKVKEPLEPTALEAIIAILGIAVVFSSLPTLFASIYIDKNFNLGHKGKAILTAITFELITTVWCLIITPELIKKQSGTAGFLAVALILVVAIREELKDTTKR